MVRVESGDRKSEAYVCMGVDVEGAGGGAEKRIIFSSRRLDASCDPFCRCEKSVSTVSR